MDRIFPVQFASDLLIVSLIRLDLRGHLERCRDPLHASPALRHRWPVVVSALMVQVVVRLGQLAHADQQRPLDNY